MSYFMGILMYCITLSYFFLFTLSYGANDVFTIITGPDSQQREIPKTQDLSMDIGLGIWTRYDPSLESLPRSDGLEYMNIFAQFNADRSSQYLQYFIIFDGQTNTLYHTISFTLNTIEQHQFPIDGAKCANKWVYLYIGFKKSMDKYTIFFYEIDNKREIQMQIGEGMYATVQALEYFILGSQLNIHDAFDPSIEYQYTTFRGEISDFYFLNGADAFFSDIPTFVTSLDNILFPVPDRCSTGTQTVPLLAKLTVFSQLQFVTVSTQYLNSRYTISGWARVEALSTGEFLDSVLLRATLNQNNFDNTLIGDRMFLWKYKQSLQPELNGFYISTYGYSDPSQRQYSSQPEDEWLEQDSYYQIAITKWHYFVFEHGLTDLVQHTKIYIFFSYLNMEKTKYFLNRQQFESRPVYFSIGGDKFDQNELLLGQVSDFVFSYCFKIDQIYKIPCHYTCQECSGPTANDCLSCVDPASSNRQLLPQTNECVCKENFIEINQNVDCKDPLLLFDNVLIEEFEETLICEYGEFLVQNQLCLKCPQPLQDQGFYCADCWDNPRTWYMNSQCTYDMLIYDITTPTNFIRKTRTSMEIEFYLIDIANKQLNICNGCLGYQTSSDQIAFKTNSLSQTVNVVCKSCFKYYEGKCILIQNNCNKCQLNNDAIFCLDCMSGYVLTTIGCEKCPSNCLSCSSNYNYITCNQCKDGYGVFGGYCQQCGQYCGICGLYYNTIINVAVLKCQKCIDPQLYFQSFDGINCIKNSIPNCKFANQLRVGLLQYVESSTDLYIPPYIDYSTTQLRCMLCEPGYTNTIDQPKCENLGSTAIESMNYYGTIQALLADTPESLTPMNSRCTINKCIVCHPQYFGAHDFCVQCFNGYYPELTGQCNKCPQDRFCQTCSEQNKYFKDHWKWEIRNYYRIYVNIYEVHSFTQSSQTLALLDYEIICTSCKSGYILYTGSCIKDCEKGCQNCQIINGKSECVQCDNTVQGQTLSYENNHCLTCPYNCVYCRISSKQEMEAVNSEFNPDYSNLIPYSYQCLKGFSNPDLYFDWNINLFVQCTMNKVCYKKASLPLMVYCSDKTYQADLIASSNQEEFKKHNSAISEVFSNSQSPHFPQIENYNFYDQMNKKQIKQFTIQLSFKYNDGEDCIIPSLSFLNSTVQKNIFSIKNLELELNGDITKNVVINELVDINGFQKITFKNIKFYNKFDYIIKIKHRKNVEVVFNNILLENYMISQAKLAQFKIINPQSITLSNFELSNCNIQNTFGIIAYDFDYLQENKLIFKVQDFKIANSKFYNTQILIFNILSFSSNQNFEFNQIMVQNSYFENTNLFSNQLIQDVQISIQSTILIQGFHTENINCVNSQFIILYDIKQLDLIDIAISGSQFQNSLYLQSNSFKITNFILRDSILANSQMIVNQKSSNQIYSEQIDYELNNLEFADNQYYQSSHQAFLFILKNQNQYTKVTITNLKLSLNRLLYDNSIKDQKILSETANFYIQADEIILTKVDIIRAMGYPEFSLLDSNSLSIQDLTSSLGNNYHIKTIHSSLQCVQQYLIEQIVTTMIYFMNNKEVLLEKIYIDNIIVANLPLFLFKSLDRLTQQNIEIIKIKNSHFNRITLIITKVSQQQSIIYIESEQVQVISILDSQFSNNHQHSYVSDETYKSSSTIQILSTLSSVNLNHLVFQSNLVTNSHSSNLYIIAERVQVTESNFYNTNIINYENLKNNIIWSNDLSEQVYIENLEKILPIYSYGGCGNLNVGQLVISNIQVLNSTSQLGGAFYIETQSDGILAITNTKFQNVRSSMDYGKISLGGALFIDGSESYLKLTIQNCSFSQCYSRGSGGSIYVIPSKIDSNISIDSVIVKDSFSFDSGILQILKSTSATASLQVFLNSITINNTLNGIQEYLGSIVEMTQNELTQQGQNYLFFIQTGKIHINLLSIVSSILSGLVYLEDQSLIQINNFFVSKVQLGGQSLWKIKLQKSTESRVVLSNIKFQNITQFEPSVDNQSPDCSLTNVQGDQYACLLNIIPPNTLKYYFQNYMKMQLALCHLTTLYNIQLQKESIFQIITIKTIHKVLISNAEFSGISCQNCSSGLVNFTGIDSTNNVNLISIVNLRLNDNNCGKTGCLALEGTEIKNYQLPIYTETASQNSRLLALQSEEKYGLRYSIQIIQSSFIRNSANYGAGMFIIQVTVLIDDCKFNQNEASQAGGAIFYIGKDKTNFNIYTSQLSNNKAKIGGAIYIMDSFFNTPSKLDILLMGNEAASFGTNLVVNPSKLGVSLNKGQDILKIARALEKRYEIIDYVDITPYLQKGEIKSFVTLPSGQQISSYSFYSEDLKAHISANLTFRIIPLNEQNKQMKYLSNTKCLITSRILNINDSNSTSGVFDNQNLNLKEVYFNETSQDYNFDSLIIKFDPNFKNSKVLQLKFICDSIKIPVFSVEPPYLFESYSENYTLLMNVQTYTCQRGEFKNLEDGTCLICDSSQDQFSVIAGSKCQIKDSLTTEEVTSARLKLRSTYWRPWETSTKTEYCKNMPQNCEGGWDPGNPSCFKGHIGALCEQCDLYNVQGDGAYSISTSYKCGACSGIGDNLTKVILISLWTLISITLSVNGTLDSIDQALLAKKMKKIGVSVNARSGFGSILIKVLTNYFQILATIATFQMQLPSALSSTFSSVGSPLEAMSYSLDCFLVTLAEQSNIEMIYFRIIWGLLMPIFYITAFLALYGIAAIGNYVRKSMSVITTTFIYMYIFLQPTLISGFMALLSFRVISDVTWIQGNVGYQYNTPEHTKWILGFILPCIGTVVVLIPLFMFWSLYSIRSTLDDTKNRRKWGYLYNEYRQKAYFWELVKIQQKSLIIIFLIFYEDLIVIKAAMIFIIIFLYKMLSKKYQPYEMHLLNDYDDESSLICSLSIVVGITIYSATITGNQEIVWPFYIILLVINGLFIFKLGIQILFTQLENQQERLDKLRDKVNEKFPDLQHSNQILRYLLTNRNEKSKRVKLRFKQIKGYLFKIAREILKFKEIQEAKFIQKNKTPQLQFAITKNLDYQYSSPVNRQLSDNKLIKFNEQEIYQLQDELSPSV